MVPSSYTSDLRYKEGLLTSPHPEATWERGGCWQRGEAVLGRVQRGASPSEMFVGL